MPLHAFALLGSFVEEIVAPIPAPLVMTTAGSLALVQDYTFLGLAILALLGSIGKTGGSVVLYYIADKGEDFVTGRLGKYLNISHEEIERLGSYFSGSWKDTAILTVLRSIPIVPSVALSLGCGIVKLPMRVYLPATLIGDTVRGLFFLYIGYAGLKSYEKLAAHVSNIEDYAGIAFVIFIIVVLGLLYWQRQTGGLNRFLQKFLSRPKK